MGAYKVLLIPRHRNQQGGRSRYTESQNRRDLPRDNLLVSVEVLRYDIKRSKSENKRIVPTEMELVLEQTQQEHQSDTQVFSVTMEILPEPTSNKLCGSWKSCQGDSSLKMNLPEHRKLTAFTQRQKLNGYKLKPQVKDHTSKYKISNTRIKDFELEPKINRKIAEALVSIFQEVAPPLGGDY
ncbi:hypothetical protein Tco_1168040 [Tanacetum coccineum]